MSKYPQDQPEETNKANDAEARKEPAKNDHSPKSTLSPTPGDDAEWAGRMDELEIERAQLYEKEVTQPDEDTNRTISQETPSPIERPHELVAQIEVIQQSLDKLKDAVAAIDSAKDADTVWFPASPEGRANLLREYARTFKERVSALMSEIDSSLKAISDDAQSLRR